MSAREVLLMALAAASGIAIAAVVILTWAPVVTWDRIAPTRFPGSGVEAGWTPAPLLLPTKKGRPEERPEV